MKYIYLYKYRTPVIADNCIDFNDSIQPPYRSTRSSLSYSPSSEEQSFKRSMSNRSSLVYIYIIIYIYYNRITVIIMV